MEKKFCTFIIPVYNMAFYLDRCLRSCVHPNVEIIAIDDGSTDHSLKILEEWQQKDSAIRVLSSSHRGACSCKKIGPF